MDVFKNIIRPKILLHAAKHNLLGYSRNKELKRLLKLRIIPMESRVLKLLIARETALEKARKTGNAAYDMKLHIQIMTALLQEIRLWRKKS